MSKVWRDHDEADVLGRIAGWAIGSETATEHHAQVVDLVERGFVTTRWHRPREIDGWFAYKLTAEGFERLKTLNIKRFERALKQHAHYAEPEEKA